MKQWLMLAHALMRRPDVLILDELANGLDPAEVRALRQHLSAHAAAGSTVLISSHQLAEVQLLASHIVVMHPGRVVTAGPLDDLLGGICTYRVRTEDPGRTLAVLCGGRGVTSATVENGDLIVTAPAVPASVLVEPLVKAGVAGTGASPAYESLEDAYLAVT
jgi:ABC-type multidrug transport system ATPase subunit